MEKTIIRFAKEAVWTHPWIDGIVQSVQEPPESKPGWRAAYFFFMLIATDLRFRIAKCRECGTYFLLPARRATYKAGTRCSACYKKTRDLEAWEITRTSREQQRKQLYCHIRVSFGDEIAENPAWDEDIALVSRIVKSVNAAIASGKLSHKPITSKWVVRKSDPDNRSAISRLATKVEVAKA